MNNIFTWFYEDLGFIDLSKFYWKDSIRKLSTIEKIWEYVKELEAEAYYRILDLKFHRDYESTYIDLMILMDTIIVRYVKVKYNGNKDTKYYALMLGEVK